MGKLPILIDFGQFLNTNHHNSARDTKAHASMQLSWHDLKILKIQCFQLDRLNLRQSAL